MGIKKSKAWGLQLLSEPTSNALEGKPPSAGVPRASEEQNLLTKVYHSCGGKEETSLFKVKPLESGG